MQQDPEARNRNKKCVDPDGGDKNNGVNQEEENTRPPKAEAIGVWFLQQILRHQVSIEISQGEKKQYACEKEGASKIEWQTNMPNMQ